MYKLSIVTVVFNGKLELAKTIDSIRKQDYRKIEYVVVDGGSDDGTLEVIKENLDLIDLWVSEPDEGIYDAMNKGWKMATGGYVVFMNAGDTFYERCTLSKVNQQLNYSDVLYGGCCVQGSRASNGIKSGRPVVELVKGMVCSHQSMFFKRDLLLLRGYSLEYGTAGDYELICYFYAKGFKFTCIGEVISNFAAGGVSDVRRLESIYNAYKSASLHLNLRVNHKVYWARSYFFELAKATYRKWLN